MVHLDQATAHHRSNRAHFHSNPNHQPGITAHQDPNMDSLLQQPSPISFPGQSQVYTEVPGCAPTHRRRQRRQPRGAWRTSLHADCHSALPEHIGHPTRTQPSRPQDADGKRLAHHVRRGRQPTRSTYDFRAEGRICQHRQRGCVFWSQLAGRDVTSPLFHLPLRMRGPGVGSAVQRHTTAPWTAWQSIIPTLMEATDSPDTDSLFASTPILRGQLHQLQTTLSPQMNAPSLLLKSLGAALRMHGSQKALVNTTQQTTHQQLLTSLSTNPIQKAILVYQTAKKHWRAPTATQQRGIRSG